MNQPLASTAVRTTCPYCGVGCGVLATPQADGSVAIAGDPDHPANFGRLCSKGSALGETLSLDGRLLYPEIDGARVTWDEALERVANTFTQTIAEFGPDSVAIYGSGQLLTEDYYVANKLMKGFIGSGNMDTNSRLCMASSVAGHRRAFGSDTVPGNYEDLELADLVVLVGSNLGWCHPVLYQRIVNAKAERPNMRVVLIDPRRTVTADIADLHLAVQSDGDSALFVGLLAHLADNGVTAPDFVAAHTSGLDATLLVAEDWSVARVASATGLSEKSVALFYDWFAATEKTVTVYSQGVNQSASGTDKVNAIINCHLLTGRIGRPGMGPFSVTGQPNAMGGREVGGLANMLAAHMDFTPEAIDRVGRFWGSDRVASRPGLKAVDLFAAMARGEIKAVWIMATNPVDSMPEADAVRAALAACPFVVVSDMSARTDTGVTAHVRLPAAGWGEKDGTVTNSERRISRQRPFLALPGEVRPDWWIIKEVASRMGFEQAFSYRSPAQIFAEHVALSAFENDGARDFDLSGLAGADYGNLPPTQWPVRHRPAARMFGDGVFFTSDGKARFVPVLPPPPFAPAPGSFILNTGRVRDHWHTMTRTGKTARLSAHYAEPFVEIHPADAGALNIRRASLVRLSNRHGSAVVRALVTDRQRRGHLFVPMHWTDQFASNGRIDALVTAKVDPFSAQPALKMAEVHAEPVHTRIYGFFVSAGRPVLDAGYWAIAEAIGGTRGELGWFEEPVDWSEWLRAAFGLSGTTIVESVLDARSGRRNFAVIEKGRLVVALYTAPDPVLVSRQWATDLLVADNLGASAVLAGRPGADMPDSGAIICSCFSVGINTITAAVTQQGCSTVEAVGACTRAGTNCGSCRAEIRGIIDASRLQAAE
ncbi:MAG: molybdopterin-dependent oxidoreductase [Alphaproteobacteria bacterium]|nr:molybdopterin-dependent oxidoreductase [Alphaproteobacteria bacterium]MBU1563399.1 molybdopterin-dependent oxidoreductase [Alphaproteobacteria bacterium]MBU2301112.1 molybdopterin-dependent oxidoreductase [Alphaproteobacteria bacterium]MBU2366867.1 molybdopterin-dependent oxidoreductase [Alphaproteobacteria bacterium]